MFNFLKSKKPTITHPEPEPIVETPTTPQPEKKGLFARLKAGLAKTRANFTSSIASLILGKKILDQELIDLIEMQLLTADVGVDVTQKLIQNLTQKLARNELKDSETVLRSLQQEMLNILKPCQISLTPSQNQKPFVVLVVGINGSGKTTTIGKLAKRLQETGKNVMLAAGDTFRAAAIEQLQIWGGAKWRSRHCTTTRRRYCGCHL